MPGRVWLRLGEPRRLILRPAPLAPQPTSRRTESQIISMPANRLAKGIHRLSVSAGWWDEYPADAVGGSLGFLSKRNFFGGWNGAIELERRRLSYFL
jgi:hypothetical protein